MTEEEIKYHTDKLKIDTNGQMVLYKYIDLEGGISLIKNNTFKFSHPTDFNDPFDLHEDLIDFTVHDHLLNYNKLNRKERRKLNTTSKTKKAEMLKLEWKRQKSDYGISCFSKNYDNILMWSHYANKHLGLCIGLKVDANRLLYDKIYAFAVEYANDFKSLPYADKEGLESRLKTIMHYLSTKADCWEYEDEIRLVDLNFFKKNKSGFLSFMPYGEIIEIHFGMKTVKDDISRVRKLFSGVKEKPNFYKMIQKNNKFELDRK